MARGLIRKPSFRKVLGAYRSQWKRAWMRLFTFGMYGRKGMGWLTNPKKAWYNFWYHRTSVSLFRIFGCKPSFGACLFGCLFACIFSIAVAPLDAVSAGVKANKIKKARVERATEQKKRREKQEEERIRREREKNSGANRKENNKGLQGDHHLSKTRQPETGKSQSAQKSATPIDTPAPSASAVKTARAVLSKPDAPKKKTVVDDKPDYLFKPMPAGPEAVKIAKPKAEPPKGIDENVPKSKPKNPKDQYVRKRMIIDGFSYCDGFAHASLKVGTYFDLVDDPDNPNDRRAVALLYEGKKIGYVAKGDQLAFATCLKLKRRVYGVITDIKDTETPVKYEYEAWIETV